MIRYVKKLILDPKIIKFYTLSIGLTHLGQVINDMTKFLSNVFCQCMKVSTRSPGVNCRLTDGPESVHILTNQEREEEMRIQDSFQ